MNTKTLINEHLQNDILANITDSITDGGYFCAKDEIDLQCSNSNEIMSLHQIRLVNISEYAWADVCGAKKFNGDACHVRTLVDSIKNNCVGKRSCRFQNPCADTTKYAEIAMDCVGKNGARQLSYITFTMHDTYIV